MRILLVEDDPMIADAVKAALSDEAHAVHLVTNGRNALAQLSVNTFQLVLLDLGLPAVDGMTVLRTMRAEKTTRRSSSSLPATISRTASRGSTPVRTTIS